MDGRDDKADLKTTVRDVLRIVSFLRPFKKQFLLVLLMVLVANIAGLGRPRAVGWGINHLDELLKKGNVSARDALLFGGIPVGAYILFGLLQCFMFRVRPVLGMSLNVALLRHLRTLVYNKTQRLSFNYLDRLTNGQIIERATGDVTEIQNFLTGSFVHVFDAVVTIAVMLLFMFQMNAELALVVLAPFPFVLYAFAKIAGRVRILSRHTRDQADVMTTQLAEGIAGARVIRSFGTEPLVQRRYGQVLGELYRRAMRTFRLREFGLQAIFHASSMVRALLVGYGGWMIIRGRGYFLDGSLKIGDFMTYTFYVGMFIWRVQPLMHAGDSVQVARAAFERIAALLDAAPDVADAPDAVELPAGGGQVAFRNVSFAYQVPPHPDADVTERMVLQFPPRAPAAVRDVTLDVKGGEVIALVGPTGAGKSTIVSLLPRFYDPGAGQILIDGVDIRKVRLDSLRRSIALVFQETFLFLGTIAENIAYGLPHIPRSEIHIAARLAQAAEFVEQLPLGYDSPIGERGVSLSGGQRQRLAIARAILMKPRILILDDATASVDASTEYRIRQGLKELMAHRTTFIIAHRLATIRSADRIVVLKEGRIEDVGTHDELLARNEFYQTLYEAQMAEQDDGEATV
ncbi:MAG: ABC transporter ATP-binding protein [Planctomycetes bacterium]|nr:ABC transporter ATP-binding protein [Planctomycetota bacterium]